jgi:pyruvate formate lyase activating enzyme
LPRSIAASKANLPNANISMKSTVTELRVGGLARWSTCDWPGQLAATVFCQGCSWACPYCHNPHLRPVTGEDAISWPEVRTFLESRRGLLDGVVFSGGEPLLQAALVDAAEEARALGFRVGLHTGGSAPERFARVLPRIDWVGFDIKAPFAEYDRITQVAGSAVAAMKSLHLLLRSGVAYQLRTTVHPHLLDDAAIARLNADLASLGVGPTRIQRFRAQGCSDPILSKAVA